MDDRLEKALRTANYRTTLYQQKETLKIKLQNALTIAENGGIFKVNESLVSFVDILLRNGIESTVLLDSRTNPVEITDLQSFHRLLIETYREATSDYLLAFNKLKKARTVQQAIE